MHRLAGILLQMQPRDADRADRATLQLDVDDALTHDRMGELADLIAGGQIGIEVVLAVEAADEVDLGVQP
jgi:hypothetical protein